MGIFDFFKSEEQREREKDFKKLFDEIFPGGKKQVEEEVRKTRLLLDYRYSKEDTYKTYFHASSIFHIAQDKSEDRIVASILSNKESVVTKADAKLIYKYLKDKYMQSPAAKLTQAIETLNKEQQLLLVAKGGIVELKNEYAKESLTTGGRFEALIFNSLIIFSEISSNLGEDAKGLKEKYFEALMLTGVNEYKITDDFLILDTIIKSRMAFYSEELNNVISQDEYSPLKIYWAFFKNELQVNVESDEFPDVVQLMEFSEGLIRMITWVSENVKKFL